MSKVSITNLAQAIYESSYDKDDNALSELNNGVIEFLRKNNLLNKTETLLSEIQKIEDKENNTLRVKITSANKLKKETIAKIEEFIRKKYNVANIVTDTTERNDLLGGFKIEIGDEITDTTLSHKINKLQNYLIAN